MARRAETPASVLGRDLLLTPFFQADSWRTVDLVTRPTARPRAADTVDLAVAVEGDNLRQALVLRMVTPQGSLRDLGHAAYGSRLHELVGEPYSEQLRLRARSFVIQAVEQERRVAEILELRVEPPSDAAPDTLKVFLHVQPQGQADPVALGLEVTL